MSLWIIWLCLVSLCGSGLASDVPFVFDEDIDLTGDSSDQLIEASSSSPNLVGVPSVISPPDNEIVQITVTGGGRTSEGKLEKEVGDLKDELNRKVEPDYRRIRDDAAILASKYPGDLRIEQICEIYIYLKYGDSDRSGWRYVRDPRGIDSWNYANESLKIGDKAECVGLGDCDDFAILMAAFVESIGGATRIILANNNSTGGHAYTEVYLGCLDDPDSQVEDIIEWLRQEYTGKIYGHLDTDTKETWLNLDWGQDEKGNAHPGGPLFQGDKHYVLRIREEYNLVPLRIPEAINRPPRLLSLVSDKSSPQESGTIVTWTAKASDPDNDRMLYRFFLDEYPATNWRYNNSWVWATNEADIGDNEIEVYARDGKHAGPNRFDAKKVCNFSITESRKEDPRMGQDSSTDFLEGGFVKSSNGNGSVMGSTGVGQDSSTDYLKGGFVKSSNGNASVMGSTGDNLSQQDAEAWWYKKGATFRSWGDTPLTIYYPGPSNFQVFVDGVEVGVGSGGSFSTKVKGGTSHVISIWDGFWMYQNNVYFESGVPKMINVEAV